MSAVTVVNALFIEDDAEEVEFARTAAKQVCTEFDLRLDVVDSGDKALKVLERIETDPGVSLPDLIILDLNLPVVSGRLLLRFFRNSQRLKAVPLIVLTGSSFSGDKNDSERLGAHLHLAKPGDFDGYRDVFRRICAFLSERRPVPK